ncbi:MAG: hypothetical protein HYY18_05975 [Planctomycetes bacterium]|nr:hypothetical protein [Planctomycetota bacterium]
MSTRGLALFSALAAGAAGVAGGFLLGRLPPVHGDGGIPMGTKTGAVLPNPAGSPSASGAGPTALEERVLRAEAEFAGLLGRPQAGPAGGPALGDLRARIGPLVAGHRGIELLALMGELAAIGEEAYPDALVIWQQLREDMLKDAEFGVSWNDFVDTVNLCMGPLLRWTLANPARAPRTVRVDAAEALGDAEPREILEFLRSEPDHEVARQLGLRLACRESEDMIPDFEAAAHAHAGDPRTVETMLEAINRVEGESATSSLLALSQSPEPAVREEAGIQLLVRRPPATGFLLNNRLDIGAPLYSAGLRRGDIVVGIGDAPLDDYGAASDEIARRRHSDATESVTVFRAGVTLTFRTSGRDLAEIGFTPFVYTPR